MPRLSHRMLGALCLFAALLVVLFGVAQNGTARPATVAADAVPATPTLDPANPPGDSFP